MEIINTSEAPQAIGPYNQAVVCGNTVYISGQIALEPDSMQLCSDKVEKQIEQAIKNLSAVCKASGGSLDNIAKLNIYLIDLSNFGIVNDLMIKHFNQPYPARAAVGVRELPKGALVEMDAVMELPRT